MSILLYTNPNNPAGKRLQRVIEVQFDSLEIDVCFSIEELAIRLRNPLPQNTVLLLSVYSLKELRAIESIHDLLEDKSNILVLPDNQKTTALIGQKLYPRFFSYQDSDFSDVAQVLTKMLQTRRLKGVDTW